MAKISKLKHSILTVSIALIFVFFVGYGISTFYPAPKYQDYCEEIFEPRPVELPSENISKQEAYYRECREAFELVNEPYNRNVFIIALIIGTIAIVLGSIVLSKENVGSGIMGGGTLTVIYGTLRYWGNLPDIGRFIALGIVLAILIWIGYKKLK